MGHIEPHISGPRKHVKENTNYDDDLTSVLINWNTRSGDVWRENKTDLNYPTDMDAS